jgi:hypothetical protein
MSQNRLLRLIIYALIATFAVYLASTEQPYSYTVPPIPEDAPYVKVCRWDQIKQQCYE